MCTVIVFSQHPNTAFVCNFHESRHAELWLFYFLNKITFILMQIFSNKQAKSTFYGIFK